MSSEDMTLENIKEEVFRYAPDKPQGPPPMNNPDFGNQGVNNPNIDPLREQQQRDPIAESLLRRDYNNAYTIVGEKLIPQIKEAAGEGDYERLNDLIQRALPLSEGLFDGILATSYGIPNEMVDLKYKPPNADRATEAEKRKLADLADNKFARLRGMFMTVEGSVDRGNIGYLRDAINESVHSMLRRVEDWEKDAGKSWRESRQKQLEELFRIENRRRRMDPVSGLAPRNIDEINKLVQANLAADVEEELGVINEITKHRDELLSLDLHIQSRAVVDSAFRQRQYVCHERDLQSNMKQSIGLGTSEPDGNHEQGFYQVDHDWGNAVDSVERELVKMAIFGVDIPDGKGGMKKTDGIFRGNPDTLQFEAIMLRMLNASKIKGEGPRRMDVVWAAWRQFHLKEMPAKFALHLSEIKDKKTKQVLGHKISFPANPPYVGDLASWVSFPEEHRAMEFGWTYETLQYYREHPEWDGKPFRKSDVVLIGYRVKPAKLPTHSGHPRGIGHATSMPPDIKIDEDHFIPSIACWGKKDEGELTNALGNFMEATTFIKGNFNNQSLYDIWMGYSDEKGYHQGISQADSKFPWVDTDLFREKSGSDEFSSGPTGYWFLQRGRAWSVLSKNFLGVPEVRKLTTFANATEGVRNEEKLGMIRPGEFSKNPMYVKLVSDFEFFIGLGAPNSKGIQEKGANYNELLLTTIDPNELLSSYDLGVPGRSANFREYAFHALENGLIDAREFQALIKMLPATQ